MEAGKLLMSRGSDQCTAQPLSQGELYNAILVLIQESEQFEQDLQADHTSHKAVKVNTKLAACIPRGNGLLHLVVEGET